MFGRHVIITQGRNASAVYSGSKDENGAVFLITFSTYVIFYSNLSIVFVLEMFHNSCFFFLYIMTHAHVDHAYKFCSIFFYSSTIILTMLQYILFNYSAILFNYYILMHSILLYFIMSSHFILLFNSIILLFSTIAVIFSLHKLSLKAVSHYLHVFILIS